MSPRTKGLEIVAGWARGYLHISSYLWYFYVQEDFFKKKKSKGKNLLRNKETKEGKKLACVYDKEKLVSCEWLRLSRSEGD